MKRGIYRAALASFKQQLFLPISSVCISFLQRVIERNLPCVSHLPCHIAACLLSQPKSLPSTSLALFAKSHLWCILYQTYTNIQSNGVLYAVMDLLHPVLYGVRWATDLEKMRFHIFSFLHTSNTNALSERYQPFYCLWHLKLATEQRNTHTRKKYSIPHARHEWATSLTECSKM